MAEEGGKIGIGMNTEVLSMKGIHKAFGVPVLKGVDFSLKKGEVHALIGGNGAGKSTLMKIMTGVYSKDAGEIFINGAPVSIDNIHDARKYGIGMIFQELSLVPTMTVAENIFLGTEIRKNGLRDTALMMKKAENILRDLHIAIDPGEKVRNLSVGLCQMVEIAKAMAQNATILVLDEPTASLSDAETRQLFDIIRGLKKKGVSMVYISHRMNEIMEISDCLSVLRDGRNVFHGRSASISMQEIIAHMLGEEGGKKFSWTPRDYDRTGTPLLEVRHLQINDRISDVSFNLKKGEILGFAGLMGSGRTEILETLFGIRQARDGEVRLDGKKLHVRHPKEAIKSGFALIPEDRRRQGLVLLHSVKENTILPHLSGLKKHRILVDEKKADALVRRNVDELGIVTDHIHKRISLLSGGNQQKVVFAKWINMQPRIMMLDEPTAGVDIGAKAEIIQLIRDYADRGNGVILVSSELAELMAVCDRIITIFDGKITGEIDRSELETEEVLQYAIQQK